MPRMKKSVFISCYLDFPKMTPNARKQGKVFKDLKEKIPNLQFYIYSQNII